MKINKDHQIINSLRISSHSKYNFLIENNKILSLQKNCYKADKLKMLMADSLVNIDSFFTDSFDDYELAKISKNINVVDGDMIFEYSNIKQFLNHFNK